MEDIFEKKFKIIELFDTYGELLTKRQSEVLTNYIDEDLNLVEIAENDGVSKQAIYDNINKSIAKLEVYEEKLNIIRNRDLNKKKIGDVVQKLNALHQNVKKPSEALSSTYYDVEIKDCIDILKELSH